MDLAVQVLLHSFHFIHYLFIYKLKQAFVFACSKTPAGRQSIRQSVKVNSSSIHVPPSPLASPVHSYSSHTERSYPASLRNEVRLTVSFYFILFLHINN